MGERVFDEWDGPAGVDDRSVMEAVVGLSGLIGEAALARLERIARLDGTGGFLADGYTSVAAFLVHRCGMGIGEANRAVFLARALTHLPYAAKLCWAGRLSVNQLEVLAHAHNRHPDAYAAEEPVLAEAASGLGLADTRRLVEYWCQAHDQPGATEPAAPSKVFLSKTWAGRGRLDGDLAPEDYCLLAAALDTLISEQVESTPQSDLVSMPELRAQALTEIARRHLDSPDTPVDHGNRPHLAVVVDWEVLAGLRRDKTSELSDGTILTAQAAQRLACDANVCRFLTGPGGEILDLGRSRRTVTAAQWKALRFRDRHCQWVGCRRPWAWCDAHHIQHWTRHDGPTDLSNLTLVCRHHHTLVHDGHWTLTGTPGHLVFTRPDGTVLNHDPP